MSGQNRTAAPGRKSEKESRVYRGVVRRLGCLTAALAVVAALLPSSATAEWPLDPARLAIDTQRVSGANRFAVAAELARASYPTWSGVRRVIVASGDDAACADPLAASGLCWAYDAPLLLTSARTTPRETKAALAQIASRNPTITVTVVGGSHTVPAARVSELRAILPSATVEQPWTTGDRYSLAANISARIATVVRVSGLSRPNAVFVANGSEADRFTDALSASAVSRSTGIPVLLSAITTVPLPTLRAIGALGSPEVIVVGGPGSVSSTAYSAMGGDARWFGQNRYSTATKIAANAIARGWANGSRVGVAAKIPDALTGAAALGRAGGVVLRTLPNRLPIESWSFLVSMGSRVATCTVLGGTVSVEPVVMGELQGAPGRPVISSPSGYVGKTMRVSGRANSNTTSVTLYVGGVKVASKGVTPYGSYDFGNVASPAKTGIVEVRGSNPDGKTCSTTRSVTRLVYPYATCIVIDKSDFRLYWVKNNQLVKSYPVAIGRPGMETPVRTWKILAKYQTDPGGVYGPRKMRLFAKSGSSWVYTSYAIHGTNEPWVIGTKASHGCIRMYNADVLELYPQVPLGTLVVTRE
jgi:lipoprotein-anchoring transpeptidase ErfK/SrfK/putative cell wall-binding protein